MVTCSSILSNVPSPKHSGLKDVNTRALRRHFDAQAAVGDSVDGQLFGRCSGEEVCPSPKPRRFTSSSLAAVAFPC